MAEPNAPSSPPASVEGQRLADSRHPLRPFPYAELLAENARRGYADREYELLDTGVFAGDRFLLSRVFYKLALNFTW